MDLSEASGWFVGKTRLDCLAQLNARRLGAYFVWQYCRVDGIAKH